MQSLASAANLIARCTSIDSLPPLLAELGFSQTTAPLTSDTLSALDLPLESGSLRVSRGEGSLRALCFELKDGDGDLRELVHRVSARLGQRVPHLYWLLFAIDARSDEICIAAFDESLPRPRIAALVVDCGNIVDSDSETVCSLASIAGSSDVLTHARWLEILGREAVNRRFFRDLQRLVGCLAQSLSSSVEPKDAAELSLLYTSRLLFLSFLETKGWLDRDHEFLANRFAECMIGGGAFHRRVLEPLFFGTLNTKPSKRAGRARDFGRVPFLNGGLFSRAAVEKRTRAYWFTDEALGDLFGELLSRYRFTAREDAVTWTEAAIDPEMLGKAFESLMSARDRKQSGAFYTPQSLVREVSRRALAYGLESAVANADRVMAVLDGDPAPPQVRQHLLGRLATIRVLDPACGSGAFLVHVLEEIAAIKSRLGAPLPTHMIRRETLTNCIYGVDINPTAVWLCELRLWLSMSIEDPEADPLKVVPLPNLDRNIRVGDSLSGGAFSQRHVVVAANRIARLRASYARSTGPRKNHLARSLDSAERQCAISALEHRLKVAEHERREVLMTARSRDLFGQRNDDAAAVARLAFLKRLTASVRLDLRRLRDGGALPFSFPASFADAAADGGFDVIVGNPPWIRTHNLDHRSRSELRERFFVYRHSAWLGGSSVARAGRGFASQVDASALFAERCSELLRHDGAMALLLPAKLWRSLAGGGARELLRTRMNLRELHDLTDARHEFGAAVYPSILVASRSDSTHGNDDQAQCIRASSADTLSARPFRIAPRALPFDESAGSPWLLVPSGVRSAFDALRACGIPLSRSRLGRPLMGVKTGCNEAFIVQHGSEIENEMLRPVVKGDQVSPWCIHWTSDQIIWTHDAHGPLEILPAGAHRHLRAYRRALELRADARGKRKWWMLFRTESADASKPRVVWSDFGKRPRAAILSAGNQAVPINSCYVIRCECEADAFTLAALMNSEVARAWLSLIAEPARGGYRRYMGWTMAVLPVPSDWRRAQSILAPLACKAIEETMPPEHELTSAVLDAFGVTCRTVEPLLAWSRQPGS